MMLRTLFLLLLFGNVDRTKSVFTWPVPKNVSSSGETINIDVNDFSITLSVAGSSLLERAARRYETIIKTASPAPTPVPQCSWQTANIPCRSDSDCEQWVQENCHPASTVSSYCKTNQFCHFSGAAEKTTESQLSILTLYISVDSNDEMLNADVDESYDLQIDGSKATLHASTVFGALRGMETFSQLSSLGRLTTATKVHDAPIWSHRGLMVDTARRFVPLRLLRTIIDGLSYSKMNVLHLHLTDEPAFRLELNAYPELTQALPNGTSYSRDDMKALAQYAKDRGVRIVPEIDVPGHAGGFRPLAATHGLTYCDGDGDKTTLAYDNATLTIVDTIFREVAEIFDEAGSIHFGADEVCKHDVCPAGCSQDDVHAFEEHVQDTIKELGFEPMGWNDVFSDPKGSEPNAAEPSCLIQNWGKSAPSVFASKGFHVIDSTYKEMYLNQQCCRVEPDTKPGFAYSLCYYRDHAGGTTGDLLRYVRGGEVAMWSDNYCPAPECKINGTYSWLYDTSEDEIFEESFGRQIFPGTAAAAGSLWSGFDDTHLVPKTGTPSDAFVEAIEAHTRRLLERGVLSCDVGCICSEDTSCQGNASAYYGGHPTPLNIQIALVNKGCDFDVKIRARQPCSSLNGDDLGVLAAAGSGQNSTFVVSGSDFILVGKAKDKSIKAGDQFSVWVGDGTWMNLEETLFVSCDDTEYINMAPAGGNAHGH